MTRLSRDIEDVAFLSWAKPTSKTPDNIRQATIRAITEGKTGGYSEPAGLLELRKEITAKLLRDNGIDASTNEVIVTVGAIEGLAAAVMAVIDPGDEVIIPVPGYSTHIQQVVLASGTPVCVPTLEDSDFSLDLVRISKAVSSRTKAILYSDPNNPTGSVYTREELKQLADIAIENNLVVITDEAYEYFTYDGHKHYSIGAFPGMKERTISVFTFTKTYAMTGWRIGYVHSSPELIPQIKKAHIPFAICAPVISQYAALEAIRGSQKCVDEFRNHYLSARNLMCERLDGLDRIFDYWKPRGSYLMLPGIRKEQGTDSLNFAKKLLREAGVSTTPGVAFKGESHLRMSFCVPEEVINKAFDRMEKYFAGSLPVLLPREP
ncbi:MAG: aminotransferase class I/II-fold pyridoxal phosphate-dependent enzyme [Candidatus Aegiribacteria sp.]|nr:aminotransferase class I/II-fold pyridoxal phosphate-dependent enzyme [Candidatus Aegiribacteria sp.]